MSFSPALLRVVGLSAGLLAPILPAVAQQPVGEPGSGKKLVEQNCMGCHRVGPSSEPRAVTVGPDFQAVAAMPTTTVLSLKVFLETPHGQMPRIQFSREEQEDIIAYIVSLAPKR